MLIQAVVYDADKDYEQFEFRLILVCLSIFLIVWVIRKIVHTIKEHKESQQELKEIMRELEETKDKAHESERFTAKAEKPASSSAPAAAAPVRAAETAAPKRSAAPAAVPEAKRHNPNENYVYVEKEEEKSAAGDLEELEEKRSQLVKYSFSWIVHLIFVLLSAAWIGLQIYDISSGEANIFYSVLFILLGLATAGFNVAAIVIQFKKKNDITRMMIEINEMAEEKEKQIQKEKTQNR